MALDINNKIKNVMSINELLIAFNFYQQYNK